MTNQPLTILIVEDSEDDALILIHKLKKGGFTPDYKRVETADTMRSALTEKNWDIVITDHNLPAFNSISALSVLNEIKPDLPLIVLSGDINQNIAVDAMRLGARDYIMKDDTTRLIPAIERELHESSTRKKMLRTEEKNKRNLQAIMDHSPTVVCVTDIHGCYTFVNQKFEKLFHVNRKDIIGKTGHDFLPKIIADVFIRNYETILQQGISIETEEVIPIDDGNHSYVCIRFPLFDDDGSIYAICAISTDITDRKRQDEQLRRSQKMDALGKLTGGIAHDYNNMLSIIMGYADLLESKLTDQPNLAKYAYQIQHAGERGARLTQKLLAFSRKNITDAQCININTLLHNEQHMLEKTLTARIKLIFDLDDNLWDVHLDVNDMEDAIINISINAMHAMKNEGQLTFKTHNEFIDDTDAKQLKITTGKYVTLNITDTGCGMNHTMLDEIFDPFFTTKGEMGTGLGLSQVYGFVQSCGGTIKVYSEVNKGTSFTVYFPRHIGNELSELPEQSQHSLNTSGNEHILIVDDEPALLRLSSETLTACGYRASTAHSVKVALEILENEAIDLILTDVVMPDSDGYKLASIVQKKYPKIKIQLTSGFNDDRHAKMVDETLYENLLHKPFTKQSLLKCIRELLDQD